MEETLLEKAKKEVTKNGQSKDITEEMIELSVAWARGEISITQARKALGKDNASSIYVTFARSLKEYFLRNGK